MGMPKQMIVLCCIVRKGNNDATCRTASDRLMTDERSDEKIVFLFPTGEQDVRRDAQTPAGSDCSIIITTQECATDFSVTGATVCQAIHWN